MVTPNYGCSQADLYTICRLIWLLCIEHIDKLGGYKSKYVLAFANENLALIKTVEAMPNRTERTETVKSSFKDVGAEQSEAVTFSLRFQGYIKEQAKRLLMRHTKPIRQTLQQCQMIPKPKLLLITTSKHAPCRSSVTDKLLRTTIKKSPKSLFGVPFKQKYAAKA